MPLQAVATFVERRNFEFSKFLVSMPLQAVATFVYDRISKSGIYRCLNAFAGSSYFC